MPSDRPQQSPFREQQLRDLSDIPREALEAALTRVAARGGAEAAHLNALLEEETAKFHRRVETASKVELSAEQKEALKTSFEASIAPWEEAGLFSKSRLAQGYRRPDFEKDYLSLFGADDAKRMEAGNELGQGYNRVVWAPEDVPLASDDPETLTYLKLLEDALREAYYGTVGGKKAKTLLIGPEKRVLSADQINLKEILWQWERYTKPGIVHNPQKLDPKKHCGQSDAEMLAALKGTEKKTGGVLRVERDQLIMPRDIGQERMSGQDWQEVMKSKKTLPSQVRAQDARQALAYILHCLKTEGWIPDFYDGNRPADSRIVLAPETYIPDESSAGAVPAFYWGMYHLQFHAAGAFVDADDSYYGVRGGVRKNNEAA